jgi:hypothetical protein
MRHPSALTCLLCLACSSSPRGPSRPPLPSVLVLRIDRVDVSPVRPGTSDPWDGSAPEADNGAECSLLAFGAGLAVPVLGEGLGLLCAASSRAPQQERELANPDLTLKLTSATNVSLESYVEPDALSHTFRYEFVVPVPALPPEGVLLEVVDADTGRNAEAVGSIRITQQMLADAWATPAHMLQLRAGGVQRIELVLSPYAPLTIPGTQLQASTQPQAIGVRALYAGEVVSIRADGAYTVGSYFDDTINPSGYPAGTGRDYNFKQPPFAGAPHGCGIAVIGQQGRLQGELVAPVNQFVAHYAEPLKVGLNDTFTSILGRDGAAHVRAADRAASASPCRETGAVSRSMIT